jgi:excisionase family DNA binding protein
LKRAAITFALHNAPLMANFLTVRQDLGALNMAIRVNFTRLCLIDGGFMAARDLRQSNMVKQEAAKDYREVSGQMKVDDSRVMTVKELSDYLKVHPSTVYRQLKRGQLPAFKVGSDWRFNVESIDRWRLEQDSFGADGR